MKSQERAHRRHLPELAGLDEALFTVVPHPLLLVDIDADAVLAANPAAAAFYGRSDAQLRETRFTTLSTKPLDLAATVAARRERVPLRYHQHASGRHLPVELTLRYFTEEDGRLCLVSILDMSAQLDSERAQRNAERKYKGIFGAAPYPILIINAKREIVEANDAARTLYGLARDEAEQPLKLAQLLADPSAIHDYLRPGTCLILAHRQRRLDGEEFLAEATVSMMRLGRGVQWIALIRDVTLAESSLALLHESEERWRFALEGHGSSVWEWNPENDAMFMSDSFRMQWGVDEPLGQSGFAWWESRMHPDDVDMARRVVLAHLTAATPMIEMEIRLRDLAGQYHWVEIRAKATAHDQNGRTQRVVGTVRVIDAERNSEQREREHAAQLLHTARLASMGEMATLIAHEINQPLAAIGNFSWVARRRMSSDPAEAERALELIQDLVRRAGEIVRRVRSFAQKDRAPQSDFSLNDAVIDIHRFIEFQAQSQDTRIELDLCPDLPLLRADSLQIGQLILNLMKNALEAMTDVPQPRRLSVRTSQATGAQVRLLVADSGCGLPGELMQEMFRPFYTTKPDGLGMGLSICRTIVENHGGSLSAEANAPRGTRFIVMLPTE